jgi:hypothetical protein
MCTQQTQDDCFRLKIYGCGSNEFVPVRWYLRQPDGAAGWIQQHRCLAAGRLVYSHSARLDLYNCTGADSDSVPRGNEFI